MYIVIKGGNLCRFFFFADRLLSRIKRKLGTHEKPTYTVYPLTVNGICTSLWAEFGYPCSF